MKRVRIKPVMIKPPARTVGRQMREKRNREIVHLHKLGYSVREIGKMPSVRLTFQHVAYILKAVKTELVK